MSFDWPVIYARNVRLGLKSRAVVQLMFKYMKKRDAGVCWAWPMTTLAQFTIGMMIIKQIILWIPLLFFFFFLEFCPATFRWRGLQEAIWKAAACLTLFFLSYWVDTAWQPFEDSETLCLYSLQRDAHLLKAQQRCRNQTPLSNKPVPMESCVRKGSRRNLHVFTFWSSTSFYVKS